MPDADPFARPESISVFAPASLSNLGPGFDTLGLALAGLGDWVDVVPRDEPGLCVEQGLGRERVLLPTDPQKNTAARAALQVMQQVETPQGLRLRVRKGIPMGSGIGGSAASAVAGAWAANEALGRPFTKAELVGAVLEGERIASGSLHGDNVLPALFGGLVLVSPTDPTQYRHIDLPSMLPLALVLPEIEILTQQARALLPSMVALTDAIRNAADLAFLLDAFRAGDWQAVGQQIMKDRLVEPVRASLVPCYEAVRQAALEAGAYGAALTGSGPALFAVCETEQVAGRVLTAMCDACATVGVEATGLVTSTDLHGVRRG